MLHLAVSAPKRPELHLNAPGKQNPVAHLDVSAPKRPELHLNAHGKQKTVLLLDMSIPQGTELQPSVLVWTTGACAAFRRAYTISA